MRILFTTLLILALAGSAFAADRTVTVTPVDGPVLTTSPARPAAPCLVGNDNPPAYAITDWIWGSESYATVFSVDEPPCGCPEGFKVEQVHFYMNFGADDVPISFNASVDFREAELDPASGCVLPGRPNCTSPLYTVNITNPGLYDIALPLGPDCDCAYFGYDYAVSINFPDPFPSTQRPDAVTDGTPLGCTSFNDFGSGWTDTSTGFGFPGELVMYADVVCCDSPVPGDAPSWGELKSIFR